MAEDSTNPFASILGALSSKKGDKGVRKDSDVKVKAQLVPAEVARYERIFSIMKEVVHPDPEVGKLEEDKEKNAMSGMNGVLKSLGIDSGSGGIGKYTALLGAGLAATALAFMTDKEKLLTMAFKVAKFLPIKLLKGLPLVGSLLNFGFAYQAFQEDKPLKGVWELTSGIAGLVPGIGTAISIGMDMIMYMFEQKEAEEAAKGKKIDFKTWLADCASNMGMTIFNNIKDGKVPLLSGFWMFGEGLGHFLIADWDKGLECWEKILPAFLGQASDEDRQSFWDGVNAMNQLTADGAEIAYEKASTWTGDAWSFVTAFFTDVGVSIQGWFNGVMDWFDKTLDEGKKQINQFTSDLFGKEIFELESEKNLTSETSAERNSREARIRAEMDEQAAANKMFGSEKMTKAEWDAIMKPIDADGSELSGDELNAWRKRRSEAFAENLSKYRAEMKKRGDAWTAGQLAGKSNTEMGYGEPQAVKDGIVHQNGRATRIDSEDSGIFAKPGGPIDKMLDQNSAVMKTIQSINAQQLNVLVEIRNGINALKSSGGGELTFASANLTQEFFE